MVTDSKTSPHNDSGRAEPSADIAAFDLDRDDAPAPLPDPFQFIPYLARLAKERRPA